jgi:hypothetical protein
MIRTLEGCHRFSDTLSGCGSIFDCCPATALTRNSALQCARLERGTCAPRCVGGQVRYLKG